MNSSWKVSILAGHWTIRLSRQHGRLLHWPKCSCVSTKTGLCKAFVVGSHFVSMPSLIVQWPTRICHF